MTDILTERKRYSVNMDAPMNGNIIIRYGFGIPDRFEQPFVENCKIESGIPFDLFVTVKGAKVEKYAW